MPIEGTGFEKCTSTMPIDEIMDIAISKIITNMTIMIIEIEAELG